MHAYFLRQDPVWITTEQLFRFHQNGFDESPVNWNLLRIHVRSKNTQIHLEVGLGISHSKKHLFLGVVTVQRFSFRPKKCTNPSNRKIGDWKKLKPEILVQNQKFWNIVGARTTAAPCNSGTDNAAGIMMIVSWTSHPFILQIHTKLPRSLLLMSTRPNQSCMFPYRYIDFRKIFYWSSSTNI